MPSPLLRVRDVAARLEYSPQHVYQLIHAGRLPAVRLGPRTIRVPRAAFEAWLEVQVDRSVDSLRAPVSSPLNDETQPCRAGFATTSTDAGARADVLCGGS